MALSSPLPSIRRQADSGVSDPRSAVAWLPILAVAGAIVLLHILTNGRYGFHRDELQFLSDARHLSWGYVSYPPLTPFIERIALGIFGLSLVGLRMFSVAAQAAALMVTALMARDLGGGRLAQITAALMIALSPLPLFEGTEFQYSSFDYLWWTLTAFFLIRLLNSENPRWWLAIGASVGLGLLTKYSIVFYVAGILGGMALTRERRYFRSLWFWGGIVLALAIFLPNLGWLLRHDFISYRFLEHIHARDVAEGRADHFLIDQLLICINVGATPLCLAGLILFLRGRRYRMLAWVYLIPFLAFYFAKGRGYYVAGAYPMLMAMGAAGAEQWLRRLPAWGRFSLEGLFFLNFAFCSAYICALVVPLASSGPLRDYAFQHNENLRDEIGWMELVKTVAGIRNSLLPDQQAHLGITTGNYGEYGAIEILGPAYGLPAPIGTVNSEWLRGYPTPQPTTIITLGISHHQANEIFTGCRLAGHNTNSLGVQNEESQYHPDIFVCGPPRKPWAVLWKEHKDFG